MRLAAISTAEPALWSGPLREQILIGVAIGDQILNLKACASEGLLAPLPSRF